jgi:hypothetical protein
MTELQEHDMMVCRACGREERASEGYPCDVCGTFICQICNMRGITRCKACTTLKGEGSTAPPSNPPAQT